MTTKQPDDLANARLFLAEVAGDLDLDAQMIEDAMPYLLGMTKHVAHRAVRPAAPLAAFLVGYASALAAQDTDGSTLETVRSKIGSVEKALEQWVEPREGEK
ncbi:MULTISPECIES: DUF6457 domain-containing protein [unclassified Rothia (in: high G+C Gram-positive bacteria)]|uniref:DUF6457 domain-containing protein n=1 Tax=unclassified Rothia (in: high G+C Gram-positive bacteria) TaxID=2689056 RepID=UPI00195A64E6|nr:MULTISPECIES: DUF6457 domain-containing protein [unclassified Rothia (in: high G+C Gram-positive bacteria)]MBM7051675.1 hypothetical protein [Rothia sp. ZJ1223]QRZ61688.1 hypothetical protein JR346_00635 [Rothia sp. ZJ932]